MTMLDSRNASLVEGHAAAVGCRTLCQHPGCARPIEVVETPFAAGGRIWRHVHGWDGYHEATPAEPSDDAEGVRLPGPTRPPRCDDCNELCPEEGYRCTEDGCGCSCRREAERARPVRAGHITTMATRAAHACQDLLAKTQFPGQDSLEFQRALDTYQRRREALRRLANALERQCGGER